jgi:hypothetical protein
MNEPIVQIVITKFKDSNGKEQYKLTCMSETKTVRVFTIHYRTKALAYINDYLCVLQCPNQSS